MDYAENMPNETTYWPPANNDGFGGLTYGSPILIACRWQDTQKMFRDMNGRETMSEAIVYPDRALAVLGRLIEGDATGNATPPEGAKEIRQAGVSPSLDGDASLHKVWL